MSDDTRSKQEALEAVAVEADPDTEEALLRLFKMQERRRKDPVLEAEYERARNNLARRVHDEGPRWFMDDTGTKWLAYEVAPEATVLDIEEAKAMVERGELDEKVLDEVAPRKQSATGMHSAIASGRLTQHHVRTLISYEPKTRYVGFSAPLEGDGEDG